MVKKQNNTVITHVKRVQDGVKQTSYTVREKLKKHPKVVTGVASGIVGVLVGLFLRRKKKKQVEVVETDGKE